MSLANGLSILFIFSNNHLLALLIFAMVSLVSFAQGCSSYFLSVPQVDKSGSVACVALEGEGMEAMLLWPQLRLLSIMAEPHQLFSFSGVYEFSLT